MNVMNTMNIKRYGQLITVSLLLALASCSRMDEMDTDIIPDGDGALTETLTLKLNTKVTLSDALEAAWDNGDQIAVWTGTSETEGGFQTCKISSNSITVSFQDESYHRYNYAVHYYGEQLPSYSDGVLSVNLPDMYEYSQVSGTKNPVPMVARSLYTDGSTLSFHAVGALARIALDGIPASTKYIKVIFDKDVTGSFVISDPESSAPYISASEASDKNVVTIALPDATNYQQYVGSYINLPVPQGAVGVTAVKTYDSEAELLATNIGGAVISGWNARRAHAKKATASFTPSFHDFIIAPGNLYTENGVMKISENAYTHIYNGTKTFTDTPADYSPNDRTIFSWNELYVMLDTGNMPTYEQATANQHGKDMSTMTFEASGKSWHVGTVDDYLRICGKAGAPLRPGATVNLTRPDGSTGSKAQSRWVKLTIAERTVENSTDALKGVLIFPDNRTINISFTAYAGNLDGDGTNNKFPNKMISFETLCDLIDNQGCAFLPAVGNYILSGNTPKYDNMGTAASIATATENPDNEAEFKWWNMQNTNLVTTNSSGVVTHPGFLGKTVRAVSVRMLRPVE